MSAFEIRAGDVLDILRTLPDESVHCVVTSPPYFGLRDYGTAVWSGGDVACSHSGVARRCDKEGRTDKQSSQKGSSSDRVSRNCLACGALRIDSQIGLEETPELFIAKLTEVFREVRRVLRSDGTCWINIGDSYAGPLGRAVAGRTPIGIQHARRQRACGWWAQAEIVVVGPDRRASEGNANRFNPGWLRFEAQRPDRHPLDAGLCLTGRWVVLAVRDHLAQAEPDAGKRKRLALFPAYSYN